MIKMKNRYTLLLFLLFSLVAGVGAQEVVISGTVYDKAGNNETFPGVNIRCRTADTKKTIRGTASDLEGRFTIKAPVGSELVFSYVSYRPTIIKVKKAVEIEKVVQSHSIKSAKVTALYQR